MPRKRRTAPSPALSSARLRPALAVPRRVFPTALLAAVALAGCGGPEPDVSAVARAVVAAHPAAAAGLQTAEPGPLGPVEVYVDRSLTMRPYLAAGATGRFRTLLEQLHNELGGDATFHGFGVAPGADSQTAEPLAVGRLLDAAAYDRVNNDYAALFGALTAGATDGAPPTRVVVTDGVQSDAAEGGLYGRIVAAARAHLARGGLFAALVYRAGYDGTYFPEGAACAGRRLQMACADRPLVLFVLAPSRGALDGLLAALGPAAQPEAVVQAGGSDARLVPLAEVTPGAPPAPEGARARRPRPVELLDALEEVAVQGFRDVPVARVRARSADAQGFVPLTFDLQFADAAPWARLPAEEQAAFLRTLRPQLRAWAYDPQADSLALDSAAVFVRTDSARVEVQADSAGGAPRVRVVVPVRRPTVGGAAAEARHFAWVLSLVPYQSAQRLVPPGLSTADDCAAGACGQTLNLAPLLGAVLKDTYVPARLLFLTEWR
jgi:hypothetical protein